MSSSLTTPPWTTRPVRLLVLTAVATTLVLASAGCTISQADDASEVDGPGPSGTASAATPTFIERSFALGSGRSRSQALILLPPLSDHPLTIAMELDRLVDVSAWAMSEIGQRLRLVSHTMQDQSCRQDADGLSCLVRLPILEAQPKALHWRFVVAKERGPGVTIHVEITIEPTAP